MITALIAASSTLLATAQAPAAHAPVNVQVSQEIQASDGMDQLQSALLERAQGLLQFQSDRDQAQPANGSGPSTVTNSAFQDLLAHTASYGSYLGLYWSVVEAVGGAFDHVYTSELSDSLAIIAALNSGMGGGPLPTDNHNLYATLPDPSGVSILTTTGGGTTSTQQFELLPFFAFQGTAPQPDFPVYLYSLTHIDGTQHSGVACQPFFPGDSTLLLTPGSEPGTTVYSTAEQMLLRWVIQEVPGTDVGLLFETVIPAYTPPLMDDDASDSTALQDGQEIAEAVICCQLAIQRWKDKMEFLLDLKKFKEKERQDKYAPEFEALGDEIKSELGSHAYQVVFEGHFFMGTGGSEMSLEEFTTKLDEFKEDYQDIEDRKNAEKDQWKAQENAFIDAYDFALWNELTACLWDIPGGVGIREELYHNVTEYILP